MKARPRDRKQLLVDAAHRQASAFHAQGRFQEALAVCLRTTRMQPKLAPAWADAAVNCIKLERWNDAIAYAQQALACGGRALAVFDALSHAHGALRQWPEVRRHGATALSLRDQRYAEPQPLPHVLPQALPPAPCAATRERNVIAFSLFGGDSKYCETAVLNVLAQPALYPHWRCRFYVDDSVPAPVLDRLRAAGAELVRVDAGMRRWPGPMWRFAALDDAALHRILFRDADSVISEREGQAVQAWIDSGKLFHAMRDCGTHTELLLAGLWGAVAGALPPLPQLLKRFFASPLTSRHFADQHFLRRYVWPYARQSLLQHDSMFGFLGAEPFPGGPMPDDFHVGYAEGSPFFTAQTALPEGSAVVWQFWRTAAGEAPPSAPVCTYPARVRDGKVTAHLPARYARWLREETATIRIVESGA